MFQAEKLRFFGLCCYCFENKYAGFVGVGARDSPAGAQPQRGPMRGPRHAHVSTPVRAWLPGMSVLGLPRLDQFMFMAAPPGAQLVNTREIQQIPHCRSSLP